MKRVVHLLFLVIVLAALAGLVAGQGFAPEAALKRMQAAAGFRVKLVACEPLVRQPVTMTFDDRGRLWVIQYLQYPNPAGLKPVKVDEYLRTVYDRVPEPPPRGPKGADRVTILEDTDGDGRFDRAKDFVTGLNLATGLCLGHGGVFIVQAPYLLFYPDRDGDDVPDGDPEVLLRGFGMEDSHAFPNSLQWGPDGWLYGAQGSTVTANIRGIEFQQGIWRYHPRTKEFELFAEGGGNTWGVDFDRRGQLIAGTNFGGYACLHQVQGAYYVKNFGKHGALHNPHAYGYFEHVPYQGFKGGHVTCGGIIYQGGAFPAEFDQQYIAANLLANAIYWHRLERRGSSFTARFGGELLIANDTWFRPVDCLVGPDGAVYVADWYDQRASHLDPIDNWDRTNGRIYKIEWAGGRQPAQGSAPAVSPSEGLRPPLAQRSTGQLIELLGHRNIWYVREARRILAERRDPAAIPVLRKLVLENRGQLALEALWTLAAGGGLDEEFALQLFDHPNEDVRAWTVRLLGDTKHVAPAVRARLVRLARSDDSPTVRSQLACTAKRLPAALDKPLAALWSKHRENVGLLRFMLRLSDPAARDRALQLAADRNAPQRDRLGLIEVLGQIGDPAAVPVLLRLLEADEPDAVRLAVLSALQPFADQRIAAKVLTLYPQMPPTLRGRAQMLLGSRPASALALVQAVDAGRIAPADVPLDQVRRLVLHGDTEITRLVEKHWGKVAPQTAGEKQARIRHLAAAVRKGKGDPTNGKLLFQKTCANCHTLFGEGTKVGPDLTGADRQNLDFMLTHIVDPSLVIRPEYVAHIALTNNGQLLTGLIVESTPDAVTLLDEKNQRTVLARSQLAELKPAPHSLMPEKLLDEMTEQQIRDLFSYLAAPKPSP